MPPVCWGAVCKATGPGQKVIALANFLADRPVPLLFGMLGRRPDPPSSRGALFLQLLTRTKWEILGGSGLKNFEGRGRGKKVDFEKIKIFRGLFP